MRKFEFIDEKDKASSFDVPQPVSLKIDNKQIYIPQDFQMIGFAVLPNDDESVKWLDFLYWKSPADSVKQSEDLNEAIQNSE